MLGRVTPLAPRPSLHFLAFEGMVKIRNLLMATLEAAYVLAGLPR
jgi:hypothetical protein